MEKLANLFLLKLLTFFSPKMPEKYMISLVIIIPSFPMLLLVLLKKSFDKSSVFLHIKENFYIFPASCFGIIFPVLGLDLSLTLVNIYV